jgi:polyketide synthase PksJ
MAARAARRAGPEARAPHPLLGALVVGTPSFALYRRRIDPARDWVLGEHRLSGRPTLPGTAYLELAWAVAAEQLGGQRILLRDLTHPVSLDTGAGEAVEVWTRARRTGAVLAIEVHGRAAGTDAPARIHMTCTASLLDSGARAPVAVDRLRDQCDGERSPEVLLAARRGRIDLGPRWRCMDRLWVGRQHAVAELKAPEASSPDGAAHPLSPALVDMAAGCAAHLVSGDLLPYSYGVVRVHGPLHGRVVAHASLVERSARACRFDVTLYDPQGAALVEIDDYFLMVRTAVAPEDDQ